MVSPLRRALAALVVLGSLAGCTSVAAPPKDATSAPAPAPLTVDDAGFAQALHAVLLDGSRTEARRAKVLGVARAQLVHARERFERGADERAVRSVFGAFYLLRQGEESPGIIDASTAPALDGAIRRLAAKGDEGRTRVLYRLRLGVATGPERADIERHLAALDRWTAETRTGRPIERAGDAQRAAMGQALLDPTKIDEAVRLTGAWIDLGIEHNVSFRQTGKRPRPEEAVEIARALGTGGAAVVALLLRFGSAQAAAEKVEVSSARRVLDPDLYAQLQLALSRDDAESYRSLFAALHAQTEGRVGGELGIDEDLLEAAFFAIATEAYRRDPSHMDTAAELSRSLTRLGMSEVVPLVLQSGLGAEPPASAASAAVRSLAGALEADARANDIAAARRTIAASAPLLVTAERSLAAGAAGARGASGVAAVAELRVRMAGILVRGGLLDEARPLLQAAIAARPTPESHLMLAMVERQGGRPDQAVAAAKSAASAPGADPLDAADAHLMLFELHRDAGRSQDAQSSLARSLELVTPLSSGKSGGPTRVRAQRTLGRVLSAFGDSLGARKAFARALEEMGGDPRLVGVTMLQAASSALVRSDLEGARTALRKGQEAGAPVEDLVYGALWLMLVEKHLRATPDGTAAEIFEGAASSTAWVGKLASWAKGRLTDDALLRVAFSESTRVEAAFYIAMLRRTAGSPADDSLRKVAESPVLDLIEVQIARDILAPRTTFALPKGAKVP